MITPRARYSRDGCLSVVVGFESIWTPKPESNQN